MEYGLTLIIFLILYGAGVYFIPQTPQKKWVNAIFVACVFLPYLFCVFTILQDVGPTDWNFLNALPTANVSPFIFTICPLCLILPKKANKCLLTLISLLSFGMLCAGSITCIFNILRNYKFHLTIALDTAMHFILSFFGVYLVKTNQTEFSVRDCIVSGLSIVGVALFMFVHNLIFRSTFFGLSLYGGHNIYNVVVCDNGILSAIIYFLGLITVLTIGYFYQKLLLKIPSNKKDAT